MKNFDKLVQEAIDRMPEDANLQSDLAGIKVKPEDLKLNGGQITLAGKRAADYKEMNHVYRVCNQCGNHIEKSSGRYAKYCSNCGDLVNGDDKEVVIEGNKEEYQEFFQKKLKEWKIKSPSELSDEDKKKFFAEVEKEYDKEDKSTDDKDK